MSVLQQSPRAKTSFGWYQDYDWPTGWQRLIVVEHSAAVCGLLLQEVYEPDGPIEVFNHVTDLCVGVGSAADVSGLMQNLSTRTEGTEYAPEPGSVRAMLQIRHHAKKLEYLVDEAQQLRGKQRCVGWPSHPKGQRATRLLKPLGFKTVGPATVRHVKLIADGSRFTRPYRADNTWTPEGPQQRAMVDRG